ncbi:endonuclease/exonuclease/phosphatase family protein [Streptomyces sp. CC208A]|uniref:endonuclease/exonuclease/phosphatase family protein n=1 Tax=Streptomyces sp. CC208A TaxID=3044573 RepID=UPI0024A8B386|nr:endonuclease/exonuclease/phosphatase family protein [Streptomyces sp. CC208A]
MAVAGREGKPGDRGWRRAFRRKAGGGRRRGRLLTALGAVTGGLLALHRFVPNTPGRLGSLLESFLFWLGPLTAALFLCAAVRRARTALAVLLVPAAAWAVAFGPLLLPAPAPGERELTVAQHNVADDNADPAGTARALADSGADLVALQELVDPALAVYREVLAPRYPYHSVQGTVGLWSRHPLTGARALDVKPRDIAEPWRRALRAEVRTPYGEVAAYVVHLPSVRLGPSGLASARRDESAARLGRILAAESSARIVLAGDLNGTVDDRGLAPLTSRLGAPERGIALSYPAGLPLARIDQVLARGARVPSIRTLPATGSDHLPVLARVAFDAAP